MKARRRRAPTQTKYDSARQRILWLLRGHTDTQPYDRDDPHRARQYEAAIRARYARVAGAIARIANPFPRDTRAELRGIALGWCLGMQETAAAPLTGEAWLRRQLDALQTAEG